MTKHRMHSDAFKNNIELSNWKLIVCRLLKKLIFDTENCAGNWCGILHRTKYYRFYVLKKKPFQELLNCKKKKKKKKKFVIFLNFSKLICSQNILVLHINMHMIYRVEWQNWEHVVYK